MQDRGSLNLFACRHGPASVGSYLDRLRSAGGKPPSHERENGYPHSHMLTETTRVCKRGFPIGTVSGKARAFSESMVFRERRRLMLAERQPADNRS